MYIYIFKNICLLLCMNIYIYIYIYIYILGPLFLLRLKRDCFPFGSSAMRRWRSDPSQARESAAAFAVVGRDRKTNLASWHEPRRTRPSWKHGVLNLVFQDFTSMFQILALELERLRNRRRARVLFSGTALVQTVVLVRDHIILLWGINVEGAC